MSFWLSSQGDWLSQIWQVPACWGLANLGKSANLLASRFARPVPRTGQATIYQSWPILDSPRDWDWLKSASLLGSAKAHRPET